MSWSLRNTSALLWLGLGLLAGLMVAGFWPSVPLHAVSTDKIDTFSMATGHVEDYEAVYFLDHLTGDLRAYVVGRNRAGFGILQFSYRNVLQDFKGDGDKAHKFLMVTGTADLNRGGRAANALPSRSVLYVADVSSGMAGVYAIPFSPQMHTAGQYNETPLALICGISFRKAPPASKKGKAAATDDN